MLLKFLSLSSNRLRVCCCFSASSLAYLLGRSFGCSILYYREKCVFVQTLSTSKERKKTEREFPMTETFSLDVLFMRSISAIRDARLCSCLLRDKNQMYLSIRYVLYVSVSLPHTHFRFQKKHDTSYMKHCNLLYVSECSTWKIFHDENEIPV